MSMPLLSTKLHIPRPRTNGIARPRLTKELIAAIKHPGRFVLLSGPAGFGKTTLLSEFVAALPQPVAWLSLDAGDNDPIRFWTYLITACQSIVPGVGGSGLTLLQVPQPLPDESIPTILINDLVRLETELILVLDDYHAIQNASIHAGLSYLLEHLPDNVHFVVSTRVDPPWPLARLRARDQLLEIRARDLRFTLEETTAFLNQAMNLDLSEENVAALEARTEGWIASLQLAAISMKGRKDVAGFIKSFTGSHIFVAEYLIEEVLERQTEEAKAFLLQTCILERLNAELCEVVSGHPDSQTMLKDLYQSNLFLLPLDDEGQWYRYHQLFVDLLRARLQQTVPSDELIALHKRAMAWLGQRGFVTEAVHHALSAKDFDSVAHLVERNAYAALTRGELTTLLRWIEILPEETIQLRPQILIAKAWALTLAGAVHQVEPVLRQAEAQIEIDDKAPAASELLGNVAAIRAFFAMMLGDYPRALELAERAAALLPESSVHTRWLLPYTMGAAYRGQGEYEKAVEAFARQAQLAETYNNLILWATGVTEVAIVRRLQGRLQEALSTCHLALEKIAQRGAAQFGSLAKLEVPLIEVLREQNQLAEAHQRVTDVIVRMQNWPMPTDRIFAYLAQIRVQEAQDDLAGAFETLRAAKDLKTRHTVLMNLARSVDLSEIQLFLKSGDVTSAARLIDELPPGTSLTVSLREQELIMLARVRLMQGRLEETDRILSSLASEAEVGGRNGSLIEILALQACVLHAKSKKETAQLTLIKALELGEPEGFMRVFLDEGKAMRELLMSVARKQIAMTNEQSIRLKAYVAKLLDAFPGTPASTLNVYPPENDTDLIEPLTPRELEVLQLIAAGHSNQMIADELVITLSAVKKHAGNIFGKLNVNSRIQAILRARQLGLIPPDH